MIGGPDTEGSRPKRFRPGTAGHSGVRHGRAPLGLETTEERDRGSLPGSGMNPGKAWQGEARTGRARFVEVGRGVALIPLPLVFGREAGVFLDVC